MHESMTPGVTGGIDKLVMVYSSMQVRPRKQNMQVHTGIDIHQHAIMMSEIVECLCKKDGTFQSA